LFMIFVIVLIIVVTILVVSTEYLRSKRLISFARSSASSSNVDSIQDAEPSDGPDLRCLNCRVQLTQQKEEDGVFDAFGVQIAGAIRALSDMHYVIVQISITDVTDGIEQAKPVHSRVEQWQMDGSPVFVYHADLGRLPNHVTTLSDWMSVAQLNINWMMFPRRGKRDLQFSTSILSRWNGQELACATSTFNYDVPEFGYIDLEENVQRAKTLAVALAFAVGAADGKLCDDEVELIKEWAVDDFGSAQVSEEARCKLEGALDKTIGFFRDGNQLDTRAICKEIVEIAPLVERYDILDLCLHVAQVNGLVTAEEMSLLKNLAAWLEVDTNRFRDMVERILPVGMHEVRDEEVILGVNSDMSKETTRHQLNKEYTKWNSRVTNSDPEIQNQADQMLRLIAEARKEYIG
jgi:tellurite resistance protein